MIESLVVVGIALALLLGLYLRLYRGRPPRLVVADLRKQFHQQREHLEAEFFRVAETSGKPRGLKWIECDWGDQLELVRDRNTRQIIVLAGVTIRFEAVPGSDMEDLPAVGNLRNASGIFLHDGRRWRASGRVVFNLNPDEVIQRFAHQYERLESV